MSSGKTRHSDKIILAVLQLGEAWSDGESIAYFSDSGPRDRATATYESLRHLLSLLPRGLVKEMLRRPTNLPERIDAAMTGGPR